MPFSSPWALTCVSLHRSKLPSVESKRQANKAMLTRKCVLRSFFTQGGALVYSPRTEAEGYDRSSLLLPGLQETLAENVARRTKTPLVVILVHGGPVDVSWMQNSPRYGSILTAWYPGQVCKLVRFDCCIRWWGFMQKVIMQS